MAGMVPVFCLLGASLGVFFIGFVSDSRTADTGSWLLVMPQMFLSGAIMTIAQTTMSGPLLEWKTIRLDEQLRREILAFEPQWIERRLRMHVDFTSVTVLGDPHRLNRVWTNLIDNAIKFTPDGGHIDCTLRKTDGKAVFTIRDTGVGLSQEEEARVFERFFVADKGRSRGGGSGLGLSIAHKIVELHGGDIRL